MTNLTSTSPKKKAGKKKIRSTRRAKKKPPARRTVQGRPSNPEDLQLQTEVWEAYDRLRSTRKVAAELKLGDWVVRRVLNQDRRRMIAMIDSSMESVVADWEQAATHALRITQDGLGIVEGLFLEIQAAAAEGRVTTIRDKMGEELPVLDAINFLIVSRVLDQVTNTAAKGMQISLAYRGGAPIGERLEQAGDGGDIMEQIKAMDDLEIVKRIRASGLRPPPYLERKLKMIESRVLPKDQAKLAASPKEKPPPA